MNSAAWTSSLKEERRYKWAQFLFSKHAQRWNAENIFVSQTAVAKENITEEEELVEDFGDGYFAPYQQVFYQQDQDEDYVDNAGRQVLHHTQKKKQNQDDVDVGD